MVRNHLGIDNPNSGLPSSLAPATAGIFFEDDDDWGSGHGSPLFPVWSNPILVIIKIKTKNKKKNTKEKGDKAKTGSESVSERTKGESDFTLLSLHVKGPSCVAVPLAADKMTPV